MTDQEQHLTRDDVGLVVPPEGFDPLTADRHRLLRHGVPLRPDPQVQPGLAALWDQQVRRYRGFEHVAVRERPRAAAPATTEALGLEPTEACGYTLTSVGDPFTALFVTCNVPNLRHVPNPQGGPVRFRTFVELGFLDAHVEMTVDAADAVTARVTAVGVADVGLPVAPGDVLSASICLDPQPPARASYVLANETRGQTVSFAFDSHLPPAVTASAGISRGDASNPFNPLAQFGVVWFDEISTYTRGGFRSLTSGQAVTMVGRDGATLARPSRINDFTFKAVHVG